MLLPVDGPALQDLIVVGATLVVAKVGASPYSERKVVTLQPLTGNIRVFFGDGINTPSAADVLSKGFLVRKEAKESFECGEQQIMYIRSNNASNVDVILAERA